MLFTLLHISLHFLSWNLCNVLVFWRIKINSFYVLCWTELEKLVIIPEFLTLLFGGGVAFLIWIFSFTMSHECILLRQLYILFIRHAYDGTFSLKEKWLLFPFFLKIHRFLLLSSGTSLNLSLLDFVYEVNDFTYSTHTHVMFITLQRRKRFSWTCLKNETDGTPAQRNE